MMHAAQKEHAIVVTFNKDGKPSKVYGIENYQKMQGLPSLVQPWKKRKQRSIAPDPLGATEGKVNSTLSRNEIYE
jgi:hypothetical protein